MKFKPPLKQREDKRDEEVRRASDPRYASNNPPSRKYPEYHRDSEADLTGRLVQAPSVPVVRRVGTPVPTPNEGPANRWPGKYPDAD